MTAIRIFIYVAAACLLIAGLYWLWEWLSSKNKGDGSGLW